MAEFKDREHYIPIRKNDLIDLLCKDNALPAAERESFCQFCRLIAAIFHFEYHQRLEELKNDYAAFDPDAVTKQVKSLPQEERPGRLGELFQKFDALMERANFKKLDEAAVMDASREASAFGVQTYVDLSMFERLSIYGRGDAEGTRTRNHWFFFWRKEEVKLHIIQRLAVIAKLRKNRRLGRNVDTGAVYLKIFKDVPRMDMDMLLPGARLRMPGLQRFKLGGSWIGGLAYLIYSLGTDALSFASRGLSFVLLGPMFALLGYGYKQWYGYQSTKNAYGLRLSQSLYFQTLDSNAGVLYHLLDEAEEQECREAILAYYCLRHAGESGWPYETLDNHVEENLERLTGLKVDFEIGDALTKLERHKLVERIGERFRAAPLEKALEALDLTWDNYFQYSNRLAAEPGK